MIKLKQLLKENVDRDFTFTWWGDKRIEFYVDDTPKVLVFSLDRKDGFDGVNRLGNSYSIQYKGKGYDLKTLFNQPEIKRKLKDGIINIKNSIAKLERNSSRADHGAYGQIQRKIEAKKFALDVLKKYR